MINETKQRIEAYKAALPGIKERIAAVALMLVISVIMMASASYAWITLSRSPEVSGMATNVTANGNLEIALAGRYDDEGNVLVPNESAIGDSAAAQPLIDANLTWGNLVNLSDASYGLHEIALRPALLSGFNLTKNPLYGATYGEDGRVISTSDVYEYVSYQQLTDGSYYFAATSGLDNGAYGVRGIASIMYSNTTANAAINNLQSQTRTAYSKAIGVYLNIINGTTKVDTVRNISCMDALAMLMDIYVNEKADNVLDTSGTTIYADYSGVVTYTYRLMTEFRKVLDAEGDALLLLANLQAYANDTSRGTEYFKSVSELLSASTDTLSNLGIQSESLTSYKANCTNLDKAIKDLAPMAEAFDPDTGSGSYTYTNSSGTEVTITEVHWSAHLSTHVNKLVRIDNTEINGLPMSSFNGSNISTVLGVLNASSHNVVIKEGILADTEQRLGDHLRQNTIKVTVSVNAMSKKITATVVTDAESPFLSDKDMGYAFSLGATGSGGDAEAQDTYGMAIDMWVRTNAQDTVLTLVGNIETETRDKTCTDKNGNQAILYTMSFNNSIFDVYQLVETEDGNTVTNWYDANSNTKIGSSDELTADEGYSFTKQTEEVVTGFTGENRIWENWEEIEHALEEGIIDANYATQGSGSCYVFYAESEADQIRILDMLKAFTIAFLDQDGNHMATAKLDTEHAYAINGKVTVPMVMVKGTTYIDENGEERIGITSLIRDRATWITAVIYLDGMQLTNEDVLAVGEIEGRLNLQYGSSVDLTTMGDEPLKDLYQEFTAIATSDAGSSSDKDQIISYNYDATAKEITVTVTPTGDQPGSVSGFFVRSVSATQGAKCETEQFTKNADGTWSATFEITKPGTYSFRSVIADGVEYDLSDQPTVVISGLGISYVDSSLPTGVTMTSDGYIESEVTVTIDAAPELMPSQVRAQFWSDDNEVVNAILTYSGGRWVGTAKFLNSGAYTLKYVIMDGDETLLDAEDQETHVLYLGITAKVYSDYPEREWLFEGEVNLPMKAKLFDNTGNELTGLEDVKLYYRVSGSVVDQGGMNADIAWNKDTGYYEGVFELPSAGVFIFNRITISETDEDAIPTSEIYKADLYPTFNVIPPDPPEYINGDATVDYQFVPDGGATMAVDVQYANTAVIWALIENQEGKQFMVEGARAPLGYDDMYRFTFTVPANESGTYYGKQDGQWTIKALAVQGVYILEDGKMYSVTETAPTVDNYDDGSCYVFDIAYDDVTTYVVQTVNVATSGANGEATSETVLLGKDSEGNVTGTFMQSYTLNNVTFNVTDWNNQPIVGTATWKITHDATTQEAMGGYTGGSYGGASPVITANGGVYSAASTTLQLAGRYGTTFSLTVDGAEMVFEDILVYEVWSVKPSVRITGITPTGSNATQITYTTSWGTPTFTAGTNLTSEFTNYAATVYAKATADNSGMRRNGSYTLPTLKIKGENIGECDSATLVLPAGDADAITYTFTKAQAEQTKTLGKLVNTGVFRFHNYYHYYGYGTKTITVMTLTKDGVTYTVTLDNPLVITNPSVK